jgi:GNAT superfamily N-acetyltransferase
MSSRQDARYGRSGWSWLSETRYNLGVGGVAFVVGVTALVIHRSTFAVAIGAVFVVGSCSWRPSRGDSAATSSEPHGFIWLAQSARGRGLGASALEAVAAAARAARARALVADT